MNNFNISIFNNKTFFEIIKEIKLFSKYKINHYGDLNLCLKDAEKGNHVVVFFVNSPGEINKYNFPSILAIESMDKSDKSSSVLSEKIKVPFTIFNFKEKIISAIAKNQFKKNSLINLKGYTIDKNERKIKKNNLELQLSEKEIDFLVLFSESKKPIKRDLVLEKVWNYSEATETHIHRLRKKYWKDLMITILLKIIKMDISFE